MTDSNDNDCLSTCWKPYLTFCSKHESTLTENEVCQTKIINLSKRIFMFAKDKQFSCAYCCFMYDETGQKLNLKSKSAKALALRNKLSSSCSALALIPPSSSGVSAAGRAGAWSKVGTGVRSTVEVMATRIMFLWVDVQGNRKAFEFFAPPFKVTGTSARALWAAQQHHPVLAEVNRFKLELLERAEIGADVVHSDDASGNDLLHAGQVTDHKAKGDSMMMIR